MDGLTFDLAQTSLREVNQFLHQDPLRHGGQTVQILNPDGAHSIAVGIDAPIQVEIQGHAG
ncbi:protein glxC, partial [filamentous cyanobacterium CCP1]